MARISSLLQTRSHVTDGYVSWALEWGNAQI